MIVGAVVLVAILLNAQAWNLAPRLGKVAGPLASKKGGFPKQFRLRPHSMSTVDAEPEKYAFESNVSRVMDIIIHSLYSNKDVFLRELVSNAADACDKKRFLSLTAEIPSGDLRIRVYPNRTENTLTIEDNGIGMNKNDMIQNLGRIAESGTKRFLDTMGKEKKEDMSLIGQFGVGFYSGFLVADKIDVISKGSDGVQHRWSASADSLDQYTVSADHSSFIEGTGTKIVLHLKEEADQYLDEVALKTLIEKYSEFVSFPIEILKLVSRPEQVPDESQPLGADGEISMKTVMKKVHDWEVVNTKKPLWMRSAKQVSKEEYDEFYKQTFRAFDTPLNHAHFAVEGNVDFKALLYLPSEVPYELSRDMFASSARSMRLYVKRVFINDKFEDLIPRWLLFIRGVVDSNDLPLNVGREILQQSRSLRIIKQRLVKKSIDMISDVAKRNETEYVTFWKNFGRYLKVGIIDDEKSRDELIPLCRFHSSHSDNMTSLPDYVSRMPSDQKFIYYAIGDSRSQIAKSPALEKIRQKGYEILYLTEPVDEFTVQNIYKFNDKELKDVGKEALQDLSEEEKSEKEQKNVDTEALRTWIKEVLGDKITRVEASTRLVESPATIVQSEYGISPTMQKYLRAQAVVDDANQGQFSNVFNQAVLEINPDHPIIQSLNALYQKDPQALVAKNRVEIIFNTAALAAGYVLDSAVDYSKLIVDMMTDMATQ